MTFILGIGRYSVEEGCGILLLTFPISTCPVVWALPKSIQYIGDFSSSYERSLCFFKKRHRPVRERVVSVQVMMIFAKTESDVPDGIALLPPMKSRKSG